jgi:hypothetical protein
MPPPGVGKIPNSNLDVVKQLDCPLVQPGMERSIPEPAEELLRFNGVIVKKIILRIKKICRNNPVSH